MPVRDGHIRVLPIHVANKIAAGEVVERPSSVVKEFVENAIDAGARNIRITIVQGGRKLVSVADDGCGMTRDDAVLSLERQATSKILDVEDIERIDTLGFRGEAIPSIASVSRFSILTRRRDSDEGTLVEVNAGVLAGVRAAGCPQGTIVEARDLFCNVPARRKFLRSFQTEESHVKNVFTVHALAHPSIGFSLVVDGRDVLKLAPSASLDERVAELFGAEYFEALLPIEAEASGVKVRGYIEKPNRAYPLRRDQYVFVNSRPATAPIVQFALRESYPKQAGDARPAVILFVSCPAEDVDVNVHPTKREVRFRNASAVKTAISLAVEKALCLRAPAALPSVLPPPADPQIPAAPAPSPAASVPGNAPAPSAAVPSAAAFSVPAAFDPPPDPAGVPVQPPFRRTESLEPVQAEFVPDSSGAPSRPWKWFRFLAASASGYFLLDTDSGIVTLDPRAAVERISYERLLASRREGEDAASQRLLMPDTVVLSPAEAMRVREVLDELNSLGFSVEDFGGDSFKVDAVPLVAADIPSRDILAAVAAGLAESGAKRSVERLREETVAKSIAKSCSGLNVPGDPVSAAKLVEELVSCRMPYVTPKGRLVMMFTSNSELDRKFAKR